MRTHLEFRSDSFPAEVGEAEAVNPGRWGKALAGYLRQQLTNRGLPGGAPIAEDWGWLVPIENEGFPLWVGCGNYEEYPDAYLCFIEPSKPFVRRLLRKVDTTERVESVAAALEGALLAHPGVRNLKWWAHNADGT